MKSLFYGGIHPADGKALSAGMPLTAAPAPKQVVLPMVQHIGAACTPVVKPGDTVRLGQIVGDGEGLCVPVHASVSGTVLAVEPRRHPSGKPVLSVVLENDFLDTPDDLLTPHANYTELSAEAILEILHRAGIVGMGGATFPTDIKVKSGFGKIDTLIANGCECEPYITADDLLLRTSGEQVIQGMEILRYVLKPNRTVLAVEDNKKEAAEHLQNILRQQQGIELCVLPTRYPQGAEKQLIQAVTGREVEAGQLPASVGCAVFNTATCAAVYRAVCLGRPVTERIVTVTGEGIRKPQNFMVRIGTPFRDLIEAAGGFVMDPVKVISGGPMMGYAQENLSVPVLKGTNAILCLKAPRERKKEPVCIRCGKCLSVCPVHLQPLYLYRYEKQKDAESLHRYNALDCLECGCCAYVCPGKLPLVGSIRRAKRLVKEADAK